ncbi:MAG TPA: hypothetical protein VFO55_09895 [Gemmatimonadaceae bacterium]|nr:hypothetical protein [Gemmatimonadaceae bacterium]
MTAPAIALSSRLRPPAIVVELLAVAGLAGFEALAIPRATPIVRLLQLPGGFLGISGGLARACEIVVGTADAIFR